MDAQERGIFDELIASIESGYQTDIYESQVRGNALSCDGPFGYVPPPRDPVLLEDLGEACPPEDDSWRTPGVGHDP